ncbi:SEC66 [Sanghuangporus vaninii]
MASILAPVLYLAIVVGGLWIFSSLYRRRSASRPLEPYFPSHPERNAYVTLLQKTDPPAPDALLKAALIQRACADIRRVMRLREDKPAAQALLQKGAIGDDLWNSVLAAEKEMEAEILEVMHEANSFMNGWSQFIFNSAGEMVQNEKVRKLLEEYPKMRAEAESKYGGKKKRSTTDSASKVESGTSATIKTERSPTPQPPTEPTPEKPRSPVSASTSNGSLAPPMLGTDGESAASLSDGELVSTPSNPGKHSKKSGKKGKKRK